MHKCLGDASFSTDFIKQLTKLFAWFHHRNPSRILHFIMIPHLYCLICMKTDNTLSVWEKNVLERAVMTGCMKMEGKNTPQFYMKTRTLDIRKWFVFLKSKRGCKGLLDRLMDLLCVASPKQAS